MKKKNTLKTLAICALIFVPSLIVTTAGSIARGANTPTPSNEPGQEHQDWPAYGGAPENNHYSKLAQINGGKVNALAVAWSLYTQAEGGFQPSPLLLRG